ncbi:hypothetical protein ACQP1O_21540 [Nocardia sp. CA-151230]|uniref:hypothetical protein n=1 Tax=Nocardia sp. CA-151230 TaxID=3239982 RepID=UPI003D8FFCED
MSVTAAAQVIHGLTGPAVEGVLFERYWPSIAQVLLRQGFSWSALTELAAMETRDDSVIETKLGELHGQIDRYLRGAPRLDSWDVVAGTYGRAWRMDLIDPISAMWRMDNLWWRIRKLDRKDRGGLLVIWAGIGVKEQDDGTLPSQAVDMLGVDVLSEADLLIPPGAVDYELCKAVREALDANGY